MFYLLQSASSPRRVAVPVLVKDGKPCGSGGGANEPGRQQSSGALASPAPGHMGGAGAQNAAANHHPGAGAHSQLQHHAAAAAAASMSHVMSGGQGLQHCAYGRPNQQAVAAAAAVAAMHQQQQQQPQCGAYLPLQGRAW